MKTLSKSKLKQLLFKHKMIRLTIMDESLTYRRYRILKKGKLIKYKGGMNHYRISCFEKNYPESYLEKHSIERMYAYDKRWKLIITEVRTGPRFSKVLWRRNEITRRPRRPGSNSTPS